MKFSDSVKMYRAYIRGERVLAITTCEGYTSNLNAYARWLGEQGTPDPDVQEALSAKCVREYQASLVGRKLKMSAVRSCLFPVRGMSAFLTERGEIPADETRRVKLPPKNPGYRAPVADNEVLSLLSAPDRLTNRSMAAMMRAYLNTLAQVGLRRQEAYDLKVEDLNREESSVLVRSGKGAKMRTVYAPEEYWLAIAPWLEIRAKMGCTHDWLFAQNRIRRYSYDALGMLIHEAKRLAGLEGKAFSAHSLRHNWAKYMEKQGVPITTIQLALGHSDIQTTIIYLRTDPRDLRDMAKLPGRRAASEASQSAQMPIVTANSALVNAAPVEPATSREPQPQYVQKPPRRRLVVRR